MNAYTVSHLAHDPCQLVERQRHALAANLEAQLAIQLIERARGMEIST